MSLNRWEGACQPGWGAVSLRSLVHMPVSCRNTLMHTPGKVLSHIAAPPVAQPRGPLKSAITSGPVVLLSEHSADLPFLRSDNQAWGHLWLCSGPAPSLPLPSVCPHAPGSHASLSQPCHLPFLLLSCLRAGGPSEFRL